MAAVNGFCLAGGLITAICADIAIAAESAKFGFTEGNLSNGGSDHLIDAVIPQGSADQIAYVVRAHLDAGADHVCVQPLGEEGIPRESWTALAKVLLD